MKQLVFIAVCMILCACSTTQKITVSGNPGTTIYTPTMEELGKIPPSGKLRLQLTSDAYHAFLLSQASDKSEVVPFALNYKDHYYIGSKVGKYAGMSIGFAGLFLELVGLIALLAGGDDVATPFFLAGLGLGVGGSIIGIPGSIRNNQTSYSYNFQYFENQRTNNDITFIRPAIDNVKKPETEVSEKVKEPDNSEAASSHIKQKTERSTKSFNDYGKQLEGIYIGNGNLAFNNKSMERYANMKVIISRLSKDAVSVDIEEANGDKFFGSAGKYNIKHNTNNTYTLTNENISAATITIDTNKKLVYLHPRVNIDGDIYTLNITATKQ